MERFAPSGLAFSWDKAGLMIGDPDAPVSRILVTLTITRDAVRAARRQRVDMIVCHHPLLWEPLTALRTDDPHVRLCMSLIEMGISCFSAHTSLDVTSNGVNDALAAQLGLQDTKPLLPVSHAGQVKLVTFVPESHLAKVRAAVCEAGAGVIGDYTYCTFSSAGTGTFLPGRTARPFVGKKQRVNEEPERRFEVLTPKAVLAKVLRALLDAHPYEEPAYDVVPLDSLDPRIGLGRRGVLAHAAPLRALAGHARQALRLQAVRIVGDPKRRVKTVAVVAGSGGSEIRSMPSDIDVLVTGDVRYHEALAARERGLSVIDVGHAGGEQCIIPVVAAYLHKQLEIPVIKHSAPDPFTWAAGK